RPAVLCFKEQKELVWNDVHTDYPKYFNGKSLPAAKSGAHSHSIIYLPLLHKNKAIGVISVQSFHKNAYSEYHVHMLRNIAIYTSIAVQNAENLLRLDEKRQNLAKINQELEALTEELRQQSDTVQTQRDQLAINSARLEELLEETRSQKEMVEIKNNELESLQNTKDLMISAVNHDLRNPLNPILNYSSPNYPDPDQDKRLTMIHERAKIMFSLINDIMDVYRADKLTLQPQTANLHQAVEDAIRTICETQTDLPEIINEVPKDTYAHFEYKYIERVLENFLSNAVKYSESKAGGGRVRFHQEVGEKDGQKWLRMAITDNGVGIPQDKYEEIFRPFANPDARNIGAAKSVGIGLTFCKTIVEAHGSQIFIQSEVGKGTTFAFELPLVQTGSPTSENPPKLSDSTQVQLSAREKAQMDGLIQEMLQYELYEIELQDLIEQIEVKDKPHLEAWKNALQRAKDEDDEDGFKELLG
ncbi:MAG: GAF domain-containing sensor histidine kinase, partial [Bacteroidota bacterium]